MGRRVAGVGRRENQEEAEEGRNGRETGVPGRGWPKRG